MMRARSSPIPPTSVYGIYGFSKPGTNSLPLPIAECLGKPMDSFSGNDRNIAALARWFNGKPFDYVAPQAGPGATPYASATPAASGHAPIPNAFAGGPRGASASSSTGGR